MIPSSSDVPRRTNAECERVTGMSLPFKPHIAKLPAYKPPSVPPGVERIVDLSSNENPLGPSPKAMAALREAVETVNRYPDASGTDLKAALASRWALRPEQIALGNGADEWMLLLCLAFAGPGDEVVMAGGSFISYLLRATEVGAEAVRVPLKEHRHDLAAMAEAITGRTRLVFVCNPNNPTGTMVDAKNLEAFIEHVPENVPVVVDEAYYEYISEAQRPRTLEAIRGGRENLVVLRSFSKVYGLAGLRVGYMMGHEKVIDYMERARPPFNVNRLAQVAALAGSGQVRTACIGKTAVNNNSLQMYPGTKNPFHSLYQIRVFIKVSPESYSGFPGMQKSYFHLFRNQI